ncbi:hypothetical protein [Natrialbaceae archaeon AArc-T1-2]|uniref:hypothetical protein n=1 Tax=Natrialbaceae archaeon AArc-T1-2 TaxID=3053904 RepID=UPI00255ABA5D|nr:hypothetical protein [Natrialbaceae archaeon AArc-T1-2]WIV66873.1 hypothetical protein QQ977_14445 [Natrialbaceae archaeon AArc-T1-2]
MSQPDQTSPSDRPRQTSTPDQPGAKRRLDHEEFDPIGTLALIALYFLVLIAMWLFMYFVEFLGNELTVVGLA